MTHTDGGYAALAANIHDRLSHRQAVTGDELCELLSGPQPPVVVTLDVIRRLFQWIDDAPTGGSRNHALLLADDREAWDLLMRASINPSLHPVCLDAIVYEDSACATPHLIAANPGTPPQTLEALFELVRDCPWTENKELFTSGLVRRPNLTEGQLRGLLNELSTSTPFGEQLNWAEYAVSHSCPTGLPDWEWAGRGGLQGAVRVILNPEWPHRHYLKDEDITMLMVLTASA